MIGGARVIANGLRGGADNHTNALFADEGQWFLQERQGLQLSGLSISISVFRRRRAHARSSLAPVRDAAVPAASAAMMARVT